jgi:hypothetical protein
MADMYKFCNCFYIYFRYPLETLQHGQYSREGDIHMLAMAINEFYMGLEVNMENPMSSSMNSIPFCKIPKREVLCVFLFHFSCTMPFYL